MVFGEKTSEEARGSIHLATGMPDRYNAPDAVQLAPKTIYTFYELARRILALKFLSNFVSETVESLA